MAVMKNGQKKPLDDHIRDKQAGDDGIESAIPSDETQKEILRKVMSDLTSSNSGISYPNSYEHQIYLPVAHRQLHH